MSPLQDDMGVIGRWLSLKLFVSLSLISLSLRHVDDVLVDRWPIVFVKLKPGAAFYPIEFQLTVKPFY